MIPTESLNRGRIISMLQVGAGINRENFMILRYPRFENVKVSEFLNMPGGIYTFDRFTHSYHVKKIDKMSNMQGMNQMRELVLHIRSSPIPRRAPHHISKIRMFSGESDFNGGFMSITFRDKNEDGERMIEQRFRGFERDYCHRLVYAPLFPYVGDFVNACSFDLKGTIFEQTPHHTSPQSSNDLF